MPRLRSVIPDPIEHERVLQEMLAKLPEKKRRKAEAEIKGLRYSNKLQDNLHWNRK